MQIWGNNDIRGSANHYAMLQMARGSLIWQSRFNSVAEFDHFEIYPNFPKERFVSVVIGMQLKSIESGGSSVRVWADGELMVS